METQNAPTVTKDKHRYYPCPSCGADLLYEPSDGFLSCPYCGHKEQIPTSAAEVQERAFEQYLQIRPDQLSQLAANALEVRCQGCGATTTFIPPEVAGKCDFCGVQIVAQPQSADPIIAPEGVLPFYITPQQATNELRSWLGSLWFAPGALKQFAQPEAIDGIYLPFWTYDTNTVTHYTGQRGEHYLDTETYFETDAQGNQQLRTRQVQKTNW